MRYPELGKTSSSSRRTGISVICLLPVVALLMLVPTRAAAKPLASSDCAKLLGLKLKDTVITEATVIPAKGEAP